MGCEVEASLQCLQAIAAHLHDNEVEEQAARLNNLDEVLALGLSGHELAEFLRGAVGAASTIAAFSPALPAAPAADGPQPRHAALVASLPAVVAQATCASYAVYRLLGCLEEALSHQLELPPDVIFRLTAACGVALGPGISAAHVAHQYAAASMRPASQAQAARSLESVCGALLDVAHRAEAVLLKLGSAKPAAALRATACRPAHFVELCCKAASILEWCCDMLGPSWHLLDLLAGLKPACGLARGETVDGTSQLGLSLGSLSAAYCAALSQRLLRTPLPVMADSSFLQRWSKRWLHITSQLGSPKPRLGAAASVAGALLRLLPLRLPGDDQLMCFGVLGMTMDTFSNLNEVAMYYTVRAAMQLEQQRRQAQPQLQPHVSLPACLEGAAVSAAALAALAEMYAEKAALRDLCSSILGTSTKTYFSMLGSLVHAVTSCLDYLGVLPAEVIAPGIEACEAMMRASGRLLCLLRGSSLGSEVARLYSYSTNAVSSLALACTRAIRSWGDLPGGTRLAQQPVQASLCHLAATAAKLGRLVADLWQQGAGPKPDQDAHHADEDLELVAILCLVVEVNCEWPEDGSQAQPRATRGSRRLGGAVAALASSIDLVGAVLPHVQKRKSSGEGWGMTAVRKIGMLAPALGAMDSLTGQQGGALQLAGAEVHLVAFLHEAFMEVCQLRADSTMMANAMADAAITIIEYASSWGRSALLVVGGGLLDAAVDWAVAGAATPTRARNSAKGLEHVWEMLVAVVDAMLRHVMVQQQEQLSDAVQAAFQAWRQQVAALQQLPAARLRQQLCSRKFWQRQVGEVILPAIKTAAGLAGGAAEQPQEQQLQADLALAAQACANPECVNLRGASEGRLRCRRCSVCGVARFCSTECFKAAWPEHSRVCQVLRAAGQ